MHVFQSFVKCNCNCLSKYLEFNCNNFRTPLAPSTPCCCPTSRPRTWWAWSSTCTLARSSYTRTCSAGCSRLLSSSRSRGSLSRLCQIKTRFRWGKLEDLWNVFLQKRELKIIVAAKKIGGWGWDNFPSQFTEWDHVLLTWYNLELSPVQKARSYYMQTSFPGFSFLSADPGISVCYLTLFL